VTGPAPTSSTESIGTGNCEGRGGSKFVSGATTTFACNGKEGSPWTAGGTLPSEKTEYGAWAYSATKASTTAPSVHVALSFPIRLESPLGASAVHFEGEANFSTSCKGSLALPEPEPGQLCVYRSIDDIPSGGVSLEGICRFGESLEGCIEEGEKGADRTGALLVFSAPTAATSTGSGVFAVRAP